MDRAAMLVLATSLAFALSALVYAGIHRDDWQSRGLRGVVVTLALSSAGHFALYSLGWIAWRGT